jgi:hypothetical protein
VCASRTSSSAAVHTCLMLFLVDSRLSHPGKSYDFWFLQHVKGNTSVLTYRQLFSELMSDYPDYTVIYTHGSLLHGSIGHAFIHEGQVFYCVHSFNSVFTSELYAIYRALLNIRGQPRQCHLLCTPSLSTSRVSIAADVITWSLWKLCDKSQISVRWGNPLCFAGYPVIQACLAMKLLGKLPPMDSCSQNKLYSVTFVFIHLGHTILSSWQDELTATQNKLQAVKPSIEVW